MSELETLRQLLLQARKALRAVYNGEPVSKALLEPLLNAIDSFFFEWGGK